MILIKSLTIEDFGPFRGVQTISFPSEDGVTIIYGENMRGKTSLLNAIRYALYGNIITRGSYKLSLHRVVNSEAASEGKYNFTVVFEFEADGHQYKLTRSAKPKPHIGVPMTSDDFTEECFLVRDGAVMGPTEKNLELERIMPEQVSRFFLFDGELLQEYEELVREGSKEGIKIKESIERILGLPILTNARSDFAELHKKAQQTESKTAQADKETREIGNHLADLNEQRQKQEEELVRLKSLLDTKFSEKQELAAELKRSEKAMHLLGERDQLTEERQVLEERMTENLHKMKDLTTGGWKWALFDKLQTMHDSLSEQIRILREKQTSAAVSQEIVKLMRKAIQEQSCPVCSQGLNDEIISAVEKKISETRSLSELEGMTEELQNLSEKASKISSLKAENKTSLMLQILKEQENIRVDIADKDAKLREISAETTSFDEAKMRMQFAEHEKCIKEIGILEDGIKQQSEKVAEINTNILKLQEQLNRFVGKNLLKDRYRRELCQNLGDLFDKSVSVYREKLREKVEKEATNIFLKLTTEKDYDRLKINDSYGLTIVHKDGEDIPVRSAGAEHTVALSLMGALQKNAPFHGPIIMDSPFGRLDEAHTKNVIQTLPYLAHQVVLLVYKAEMPVELARHQLKSSLKEEYIFVRRSARHTDIQRMSGV